MVNPYHIFPTVMISCNFYFYSMKVRFVGSIRKSDKSDKRFQQDQMTILPKPHPQSNREFLLAPNDYFSS
jgi:hypothetical protein